MSLSESGFDVILILYELGNYPEALEELSSSSLTDGLSLESVLRMPTTSQPQNFRRSRMEPPRSSIPTNLRNGVEARQTPQLRSRSLKNGARRESQGISL